MSAIERETVAWQEVGATMRDANRAMAEASATITRLTAENDRLREDFAAVIARNAKLNQALGDAHHELSQVYEGADDRHWLMDTIGEAMGILERVLK